MNWTFLIYAVVVPVGGFCLGYEIAYRRLIRQITSRWPGTDSDLASIGVKVVNAHKRLYSWPIWAGLAFGFFGLVYLAATSGQG